HGRAAVLDAVLEARKPLLLQKPLAYSFAEARRLVERFAEAEIPLAVNQNLRFAPESQAARHLIARGVLGQVFDLRWTMRWTADSRPWARDAWYARDARFQILSWSIHHLDLFRFLLSQEPEAVYCALPRAPAQRFRGDILASAILRFPGGTQATMIDSNAATPGRPEFQELDIDGTEGSLWLRLSEPRDFQFWLRREMPADGENAPAHPIHFDTVWYPDGFAGAMSEFLQALEQNREPTISGRDNLHTMALVEACYRSGEERREVAVEEVFGG
ncbi:MAG TPA: Gfo/Idh/MocA family oxidoreductase, partial [Burkholderiales bacterium]|nr:Gfo/Idh/MocA family oxidoreductase [Burkholderiales bacterium]